MPKIFVVNQSEFGEADNPSGNNSPNRTSETKNDNQISNAVSQNNSLVSSLESERREHEEKFNRRQERFRNILDDFPQTFL